jgi:hypothetical protein
MCSREIQPYEREGWKVQSGCAAVRDPTEEAIEPPAIDHALGWNPSESRMGNCGFCIPELARRMRVAIERKIAASSECASRQIMIDVLPRWIAVDFNGDIDVGRGAEYCLPVGTHAGSRAVQSSTRMAEDVNSACANRGDHPARLIRR